MAKSKPKSVVGEMRKAMEDQISTLGIKEISKDGGRVNRGVVLVKVCKIVGCSDASAASAYNTVRKELIASKTIKETDLGRKAPKAKAKK